MPVTANFEHIPQLSVLGTPRGFETLNGFLFLLCHGSQDIHVFNLESREPVGCFTVPTLVVETHTCMVANELHSCLYISDNSGSCVHQVSLTFNPDGQLTSHSSAKWQIGSEKPYSVSITLDDTVLVICGRAGLLKEFTWDGQEKDPITINNSALLGNIFHALEIKNTLRPDRRLFVVTHSDPPGISVVDDRGDAQRNGFGPTEGLITPRHLIRANEVSLVVVDVGDGGQLAVVGTDLVTKHVFATPVTTGFAWNSLRVCLDVSNMKLYVADNDNDRPNNVLLYYTATF